MGAVVADTHTVIWYQIPKDVFPDMPDRIIAATALHLKSPLVVTIKFRL
jgi:PIN domain nuclease of toxin-antitoxin system